METLRIALLGAGTVGSGFVKLLDEHRGRFRALGLEPALTGILVRDPRKPRPGWVPEGLLTTDVGRVFEEVDVVVELMGGTERAGRLVLDALDHGLPVITANKALLAERWEELKPHAMEGLLYYEASVMAGTPVIEPLSGVLRGNRTLELHGILNGSTNYVIGRMEDGLGFAEALTEAQAKGFVEEDPFLDVGGIDAAHKLTVLARLAVDPDFAWEDVRAATRGIQELTREQIFEAEAEGKRIRLVASLVPNGGRWKAMVRPVKLPTNHPLAQAVQARNALLYRGDAVGEVLISGGGAGSAVTASAVVGDLLRMLEGYPGHPPLPEAVPVPDYEPEILEEA
ncbi:homoserine dehydrogenase [Oceanithermus desulfurans]|uniref:Homoserine dehydrogenase n=2 Tax=Oceanithermus desulfurans TaxID=227924 RepID=A0A511RH87_9DEIN|nr:homoserine dehydrogenase [Oceanithermus desulfurans]MBB6028965.1 homoserine dehydrogenase [Oceanithermus desulfurans]GEM89023.1 homoserine dehydrogenase [Oceanithermus desulfurans NBRC 100063]